MTAAVGPLAGASARRSRALARPFAAILRFCRLGGPLVTLAVVIVTIAVFVAIFATQLSPYDPRSVSADILVTPGSGHWLGTDDTGKDLLSNVIHGTRVTLIVGFAGALGTLLIGGLLGIVAGYFGGVVDSLVMRAAELFQVLPALVVAMVATALIGRGVVVICAAIVLATWPQTARVMRAQFLAARNAPFVDAARVNGFGWHQIALIEILPLTLTPVVVQASLEIGRAILLQAGLAYLGLGDPANPSWGEMLRRAQPYLGEAWWMSVVPGGLIFVVVLSVNAVGDAITDRLIPLERQDT